MLMERQTSIAIAHRLSTIRDVDRIYVLHNGSLAEIGNHDELLARAGVYAHLHELQSESGRAEPAAAVPPSSTAAEPADEPETPAPTS